MSAVLIRWQCLACSGGYLLQFCYICCRKFPFLMLHWVPSSTVYFRLFSVFTCGMRFNLLWIDYINGCRGSFSFIFLVKLLLNIFLTFSSQAHTVHPCCKCWYVCVCLYVNRAVLFTDCSLGHHFLITYYFFVEIESHSIQQLLSGFTLYS